MVQTKPKNQVIFKENLKLLNKCLKKDKAVLEQNYSSSDIKNRKFKPVFECCCGKKGCTKIFDNIFKSGAFCDECTQKNAHKSRNSPNKILQKQKTTIQKFKDKHGDRYDYSKVKYINVKTNIIIICKIHGEFQQKPDRHLRTSGCQKCGNQSRSVSTQKTTIDFIKDAMQIYNDTFDYSKVNYTGSKNKIQIKCNICDTDFLQTPDRHLQSKVGCAKCSLNNRINNIQKNKFNG